MKSPNSPNSKLSAYIADLKKKEAEAPPAPAKDLLLFWGTAADKSYLHHLKGCVGSATVYLRLDKPIGLKQVAMYCKAKGVSKIVTSNPAILSMLLAWTDRAAPKISNYMGSYFTIPHFDENSAESADSELPPIEIVIIPPLKNLIAVSYGKFLMTRYISKLLAPDKWYQETTFSWHLLTATTEAEDFSLMAKCFLICIDIETFRQNATIRCLSYTGFYITAEGGTASTSVVLPLDDTYALGIMRKWNWQLQAPKVMQNGKYDISYLARYNAPVYNYIYDTANMFHSWLSELPKDLGFLNAFCLRKAMYWKDLANTNDLHEYYRYNALDTWGTGNAFLSMMLEAPAYALENYVQEFPLVFPCHLAEMTGIARDMDRLRAAREEQDTIIEKLSARLDKILGVSGFNVKSPPQMKSLLKILGCADLPSADEKSLLKARFRHPFNAMVINLILDIREARTLKEKYLQVGDKAKEFPVADSISSERHAPRILYSLNPHGTDSSRLASKEHHFWVGLQVQNIPKGAAVKQTLVADPGFLIAEVDLEQAESRDTAYISGDKNLIHNVEYSPDFHSANASAFFGVPFEEIYNAHTHTVLNKPLRTLAKPVNHGANYNMGEGVLIETMGEEMIGKAKTLLNLPRSWSYKEVAHYLLTAFHKTYPGIKQVFYKGVVNEIMTTGYLKHHRPKGEPTLTRRCFGDPTKSKTVLNSYISHPPQSLNAQTLNKAWLKVFYAIAINPSHSRNFKLLAQIHDSILYQYREGHEYLCKMVADLMEIPVTIKAYDSKERTFTVPAGVKNGTPEKPSRYWSDTE